MNKNIKELLNKAGLSIIAIKLDEIEEYNLIGTNPKQIFDGLPIKLLRNVNSDYGVQLIYTCKRRKKLLYYYHKFPHLFYEPLNEWQCDYLCMISSRDDIELEDCKIMKILKCIQSREEYYRYRAYLYYRYQIRDWYTLSRTYKEEEYSDLIDKARYLYQCLDVYGEEANSVFRKKCLAIGGKFEYKDSKYGLTCPKTVHELCSASEILNNCLWRYIGDIIGGDSVILFIIDERSKQLLGAIEINPIEYEIIQIRGKDNSKLPEEVIEWIELYRVCSGL